MGAFHLKRKKFKQQEKRTLRGEERTVLFHVFNWVS